MFCVDNVHTSCSEDDLLSYVSSTGIEVFSCFKTNPRRRRNETTADVQDRKAFRLCINAADEHRLLDPDIWPDSIRVSAWFFRDKNNQPSDDGKRRKVGESVDSHSGVDAVGGSSVEGDNLSRDIDVVHHPSGADKVSVTAAPGDDMDTGNEIGNDDSNYDLANEGDETTIYHHGE